MLRLPTRCSRSQTHRARFLGCCIECQAMGAWRFRAADHGCRYERLTIALWVTLVALVLLYAALRWGNWGADFPGEQRYPGSD
jgi:hypothetical protein